MPANVSEATTTELSKTATALAPHADAWARAEAAAAAAEKAAGVETTDEQPTPEDVPSEEPKVKAEPKSKLADASEEPSDDSDDSEEEEQSEASDPELKELEELATKHGFKLDGRRVSIEERVGFRAEKREAKAKLEADRAKLQEQEGNLIAAAQPLRNALQALQQGDYDGALREMGRLTGDEELARDGMSAANKRTLKRAAGEDPRVTHLERELQSMRAERERLAAEAQERAAKEERAEQEREYDAELAAGFARGTPQERAFAKSPRLIARVREIQVQEWDGETTLSPREAMVMALSELRRDYGDLSSILSASREDEDEDDSDRERTSLERDGNGRFAARTGKETADERPKRSKPRSLKQPVEASAHAPKPFDPEAWKRKWTTELEQSRD